MTQKLHLGLIFGGKSAEHEVSLISARNVFGALNRERYEVVLIGIAKDGAWRLCPPSVFSQTSNNPLTLTLDAGGTPVAIVATAAGARVVDLNSGKVLSPIDAVFPVLHGPFGEDGTVQGLLKLANVPFVGPSVLGSAIAMDKDAAKRLLRDAGIPNSRFLTFERQDRAAISFTKVKDTLGLPLFIKPANLGSSVGIHKARDEASFNAGVDDAFLYDRKILVEEFINGKEIEVSVLGNEAPQASLPGRVIPAPQHEFYSYDAKYVDESGALLEIPAKIPAASVKLVQELAVKAYRALCLEGMARVDLFLTEDGRALVNEANTIPGFTAISMYPKLWEASGLPYRQLIEKLIELALARSKTENSLKTSIV